jgi:hypothetical protein
MGTLPQLLFTKRSSTRIGCLGLKGAAETWFEENDPEGVAFEYDVLE